MTKDQKLQKLNKQRSIYTLQDLAVIWGIKNRNTLYVTLSRYVKRGHLKKLRRGLYATVDLDQINPVELGLTALHRYGYLSTESVLVEAGIIFQDITQITLISEKSQRFDLAGRRFLVRQMKKDFLYNQAGIVVDSGLKKATVERAVADLIYYNPSFHFDARDLIDWPKVKLIQEQIGY
jgi:predicted transcriptional regulator of viral defense system